MEAQAKRVSEETGFEIKHCHLIPRHLLYPGLDLDVVYDYEIEDECVEENNDDLIDLPMAKRIAL